MLISPVQVSSINSRTQNNKIKNNNQDTRQLVSNTNYARNSKQSNVSFGMDPVSYFCVYFLTELAIAAALSAAAIAGVVGITYAVLGISSWVDNLRNKTKELFKEQIKYDQKNIYDANNYQLSMKDVKQKYNKELEDVAIKPSENGNEMGLNKVVGNSLLKLGLIRNVLSPLQKVMNGNMDAKENIPNGICFFGPKGTGKTFIAKALGEHYQANGGHFKELKFVGNDEKDIETMKQIFSEAQQKFEESGKKKYTIVLLDEADKNVQNADSESAHPLRTSRLLGLVNNCKEKGVIFVSTTNELSSMAQDLLRNGRSDLRVPVGSVEIFDVADMINYYIKKSGAATEKIDYKAITESIKTEKLVYKPDMIESIINNTVKNSSNNCVDTAKLQKAILASDLKFNPTEEAKLSSEKELAKKLGGLNENARYPGENIPELENYH